MGDELTRIGVTTAGKPAYLHPTAAACFEASADLVMLRLGINLRLRIVQAYGAADASAGTHGAPPAAIDIRTRGLTLAQILALVALLRECGWAATWYRDWVGNYHIHAACDISTWTPARYQITAVKAGYDGLGSGGRKGKDPHARPSTWRTAKTGATWARAQIAAEKSDIERLLDTMNEAQLRAIIRQESQAGASNALRTPATKGRGDEWDNTPTDLIPRTAYRLRALSAEVADLKAQVAALVAKLD